MHTGSDKEQGSTDPAGDLASPEERGHAGPPGAPAYQELSQAYDQLIASLWRAYETYRNEGDGGLKGCMLACQSVKHFIGVGHLAPEIAVPFLQVEKAFDDVMNGRSPELFSKERDDRPRSRSGYRKHEQLWAAVCLEMLHRWGDRLEPAAAKVARHVANWSYMKGDTINVVTIINWRKDMRRLSDPRHHQYLIICSDVDQRQDSRQLIQEVLRAGPPDMPGT
jgi:hypothetical protein